ncbi:MAG: anti-sigma factor [Acidobacteriaceae bacterium]
MPDQPSNPNASPARNAGRSGGVHWLGWLGWIIAALAIAAAIFFVVRSSRLQRQLSADQAHISQLAAQQALSQNLMDALTSPDSKQVTLTESARPARPMGHATYLSKSGALVFVASNLRPLSGNKSYELWVVPSSGKAPLPAGLFRPDAHGSTSVVLPSLPPGVEARAFIVTVEEAQGASTPTLPIVMSGR